MILAAMPEEVGSTTTPAPEVERPARSAGCSTTALVAISGGLIGVAWLLSGRYAACAETAGSEAGFWCMLELMVMVLAIVIATGWTAIAATVVADRVIGSSTRIRRIAPLLLGGVIVAIGLAALASALQGTGP